MTLQARGIPETLEKRMELRRALKDFVEQKALCPPISLKRLETLAAEFAETSATDTALDEMKAWLMVEINNQLWIKTVASIPRERRLLMLPKCLRRDGVCQAEFDEYGLLCHRCGRCHIPSLQDKAEELGSLSIVAEGFTQVIELIENHVVDAVIGVSCLDSLEKAFPLLVRHAVPGLAIALNDSGCRNTHVDNDYVLELLCMIDESSLTLLDHEQVHQQVDRWFSRGELSQLLSPADDRTSTVCLDWICREGKRWRPFLLTSVWQALMGKEIPTQDVKRAAVAVECFHKASLIHDDIEDRDLSRYGQPTIHALYGEAFAINAGDALLGEGYRILAESNNPELVRLIANAHMKLCKGQGAELVWSEHPTPIDMDFVTFISRHKTVPAFEVALLLGLSCTGQFAHLRPMLIEYSEALGIAYQLKDDREDFRESDGILALRPSAVLAILCTRAENQSVVEVLLQCEDMRQVLQTAENKELLETVLQEVRMLENQYHQQALDALEGLDSLELKRLLYQVTEKILG